MSISTGIDVTDLSLIFTFYTIGAVSGQLTSVLYNRRFMKLHIVLFSYVMIILLTIFLTFSNNLYIFYVLYLLIGYLLGVIWIQANKYILENKIKNKDRITTIALSFYPVGAFTAPFITSTIINNGLSWRFSYYVVVFIILVIIILYLTLIRGREDKKIVEEEKIGFKEVFVDRRSNIFFILTAILVIFYCTSETVVSTWSPTFFRSERMFDIQTAGFAVSIFWIFVVIGRIVVSSMAGKVKCHHIMLVLSIVAIASMTFMILSRTKFAILIAMGFVGLGYSGIFPLLISSGSTVYKKGRGMLATILFAASNIGISVAPFLTKTASEYDMNFSVSLAIIFMFIIMLLLIFLIIYENKIVSSEIEVIANK